LAGNDIAYLAAAQVVTDPKLQDAFEPLLKETAPNSLFSGYNMFLIVFLKWAACPQGGS
jgi:hypothetical protein